MKKTVSGMSDKHIYDLRTPALGVRRFIMMCSLLTLLMPLAFERQAGSADNAGQANTGDNIRTLAPIDARNTNPKLIPVYKLPFDKIESYDAYLDIEGDGKTWRVVKFHQIPAGLTVKMNGQPAGYINGENIVINKWYPFTKRLPLIITIPKSAQFPAALVYELNFIKEPTDALTPELAREQVKSEENIAGPQPQLQIAFQNVTPNQSPAPTPTQTASPAQASSPIVSQNQDEEFISTFWLVTIILLLVTAAVLIWLATRKPRQRGGSARSGKGGRRTGPNSLYPDPLGQGNEAGGAARRSEVKSIVAPQRGSFFSRLFSRRRPKEAGESALNGMYTPDTTTPARPIESVPPGNAPGAQPASTFPPPQGMTNPAQPNEMRPATEVTPNPAQQWAGWNEQGGPPKADTSRAPQNLDQGANRRLDDVESALGKLQLTVSNQNFGPKIETLVRDIEELKGLRGAIDAMSVQLKNELTEQFRKELNEAFSQLTDDLSRLKDELEKQKKQIEQAKKSSDNALKYMEEQTRQLQERAESLAKEFKEREEQQQNVYSKVLGELLGRDIKELREGNFDELVTEAARNIDRFFQERTPGADGLPELQEKAEAISSMLERMVGRVHSLKPDLHKLQPYVERAKTLAAGLAQFNSQLSSRKSNFQTTLSIPVGDSPGARDRFLEELGKAVKKEIDKLGDPLQHWSNELERLAKSDIVSVADICDIDVMGRPGGDRELEQSLGELFKHAGLKPIVPEPGADFKPAEQNLIQMVQGTVADSQKIKKVQVRGFYYNDNGKEQLLRKASVEVYR